MTPADVLPFSDHLHAVADDWPARSGAVRLIELPGAGKSLDAIRRSAGESGYPRPDWVECAQPVGILYREEGIGSVVKWLNGIAEKLGDSRIGLLRSIFQSAALKGTPVLRLFQYAAETLPDIVVVVSARKAFLDWDTRMDAGSRESMQDIRALWESRASGTNALPSRADILWRPSRLTLAEIEKLDRWLPRAEDLADIKAFVESAVRERAELLLDAVCTDSPAVL